MTTLKCEKIMCNHCVSRIDTALNEAKLNHKVDLDAKTVTIEGCENCVAKTAEILDDLGFTSVAMWGNSLAERPSKADIQRRFAGNFFQGRKLHYC